MAKQTVLDALPHFADPRYDTYYVPRSKTPEIQRFYDFLLANGWNFDQKKVEWHAPDSGEANNWSVRGRFAMNMEHTEAWIQPPCFRATSREHPAPGPFFKMNATSDGIVGVRLWDGRV